MTLDDILAFASSDGRVCPQPNRWHELYQMLPHRKRPDGSWLPIPLILAAWWDTPDGCKVERFRLHIRHAADHGALAAVASFLTALQPNEWHYADHAQPSKDE